MSVFSSTYKEFLDDFISLDERQRAHIVFCIDMFKKANFLSERIILLERNSGNKSALKGKSYPWEEPFKEYFKNRLESKITRLSINDGRVISALNLLWKDKKFTTGKLRKVSEELGLCEGRLRTLIKKEIGIKAGTVIKIFTVDLVKELLRNQKLSISQVSDMAGFKVLKHLYKVFNEIMKMTPKMYRKSAIV